MKPFSVVYAGRYPRNPAFLNSFLREKSYLTTLQISNRASHKPIHLRTISTKLGNFFDAPARTGWSCNKPSLQTLQISRHFSGTLTPNEDERKTQQSSYVSGIFTETALHQDTKALQKEIGYFPKSKVPKEEEYKKGWGLPKFLLYIAVHTVAIGGGIYGFKALSEMKEDNDKFISGETVEEILSDVLKVIRGGAACLLMTGNSAGHVDSLRIEPHFPEACVFRLPHEEVVKGMKNNSITDLFTGEYSEFSLPLNFVHFSLKTTSKQTVGLENDRRITLLYHDDERGVSIQMHGVASIIESEEYRRHYWRNRWVIMCNDESQYTLIKFIPFTVELQKPTGEAKLLRRMVNESEIKWELAEST